MQYSFDISSNNPSKSNNPTPAPQPPVQAPPPAPVAPIGERLLEAMQQMLELQREQFAHMVFALNENLNHARAAHAEHMARWRNLMGRWEKGFPDLAKQCKKVYPLMEKAYMNMIQNLVEELAEQGDEAFESEYTLMDYLDRHGMRLSQFGALLAIIGPLSETAPNNAES